jgi:methylated-DNA-protein-cysteine methyltransferase-like protein
MNTYQLIYQFVAHIPHGKLATYGSAAKAIGMPRGAQVVGWALKALHPDTKIPWQRVVNKNAEISIINPNFSAQLQKDLLEKEGCVFYEKNGIYTIQNPNWQIFN